MIQETEGGLGIIPFGGCIIFDLTHHTGAAKQKKLPLVWGICWKSEIW